MAVTAPNRLGRALYYVASAFRYAAQKAESKGIFFSALKDMAHRDQYMGTETMDVETLMKLAFTSAWFYSGAKLIADRVCSDEANFQVKKRVGEELRDIKNHAFEILMDRPNSLMTRDYLMGYAVFWYLLNGNAYFWIATEGIAEGEPEEIWPLPSNAVRPLPDTLRKSRLTGRPCVDYEYLVNGKEYILPGEHVIHLRNPNPFDYWRGLSFISACLQALRSDYEQGRYVEEYYGKDNAIPTAIISLAPEIGEQDFLIAQENIREEFGSKRRSAIIRGGDFDVKTIAQTLQQSDFINSRKFNRELIQQVLGIPDGLFSGNMSGDSRLASEIAFTRNTVQPLLDRFAKEFTAKVAIFYPDGENLKIVAPSIIPQDRNLKINEYQTYSQDRTINENRKELNLPPIDDLGDETLNRMLDVPIRLIPFISSNTYMSEEESAYANVEGSPGLGDTEGQIGPDNQMIEDLGRSFSTQLAAYRATLQSWKKVASKEAREGRDPASRMFQTDVLPVDWKNEISTAIRGASEERVKQVFSEYIGKTNG